MLSIWWSEAKNWTFFSQCKKICSLGFISLENSSKQLNILWLPVVADGHFLCQHGCQKVPLRKIHLVKRAEIFLTNRDVKSTFYFFVSFLAEPFLLHAVWTNITDGYFKQYFWLNSLNEKHYKEMHVVHLTLEFIFYLIYIYFNTYKICKPSLLFWLIM